MLSSEQEDELNCKCCDFSYPSTCVVSVWDVDNEWCLVCYCVESSYVDMLSIPLYVGTFGGVVLNYSYRTSTYCTKYSNRTVTLSVEKIQLINLQIIHFLL